MTSLPAVVRDGVKAALRDRGKPDPGIESAAPVGGGCINPSARLDLADGTRAFVKWNPDPLPGMFPAEADGLRALRDSATLRVPEVLGVDEPDQGPAWLLLEYLPETNPVDTYPEELGRGLAALHRAGDGTWGWERDNYIGSLPQENGPLESWAGFWRDRRLGPQLRTAADRGVLRSDEVRTVEEVLTRAEDLLGDAEQEGPSLLHGDLWSGNAYPGPGGEPVIIDPAVYRGHREVDLAMSELFGGFSGGFYDAYREAWPLSPGYEERRRDCYQLYYLLVHVNLFGRSYASGTLARARSLTSG